jgi:thymidylate kinase
MNLSMSVSGGSYCCWLLMARRKRDLPLPAIAAILVICDRYMRSSLIMLVFTMNLPLSSPSNAYP